jgi:hypothetical protein
VSDGDFPLFHVCLPEHDADSWIEVHALSADEAVLIRAEALCAEDQEWYEVFRHGPPVLVRADGETQIQRFEVELEQVPTFRASRTGTCG